MRTKPWCCTEHSLRLGQCFGTRKNRQLSENETAGDLQVYQLWRARALATRVSQATPRGPWSRRPSRVLLRRPRLQLSAITQCSQQTMITTSPFPVGTDLIDKGVETRWGEAPSPLFNGNAGSLD